MDYTDYCSKVKQFNAREDYLYDLGAAKLFLDYCLTLTNVKKIFIIGTGLGGEVKIVKDLKKMSVIGIEPRHTFYKEALKTYQKFGGRILNLTLGDFVKKFQPELAGIFLFMHTINHIPRNQLHMLKKSIKNSYIIIINPNPEIEKTVGKTDKTVISYLNCDKIKKMLKCKTIFDFFYHSVKLKRKKIFLREAILLKTK